MDNSLKGHSSCANGGPYFMKTLFNMLNTISDYRTKTWTCASKHGLMHLLNGPTLWFFFFWLHKDLLWDLHECMPIMEEEVGWRIRGKGWWLR